MKIILFFALFLPLCFIAQTDTIVIERSNAPASNKEKKRDAYYIMTRSGIKTSEGLLKNELLTGRWKFYFDNGRLQKIADYVPLYNRSNYCGLYQEFYPSGVLKVEGNYASPDSVACVNCFDRETNRPVTKAELNPVIKTGVWKEFWENGQLKATGGYYPGIHQTTHGKLIVEAVDYGVFYPGDLADEDLKEGEWLYYNEKGKPARIEYYYKGSLADVQD